VLNDGAFVNIVYGRWDPMVPENHEDYDEGLEPIEGCTREDVGWMKVQADELMPRWYHLFSHGGESWDREQRRPPEIGRP
jgi:hypothetical protein